MSPVGRWGCLGPDEPTSGFPAAQELPGDWVALGERDGQWFLEPTIVTSNVAITEASSAGARYLIPRLPGLKLGPVRPTSVVRNSEEHVVAEGGRSWRLASVDNLLAFEHDGQRWWLTPYTAEEMAQARLAGAECLTTSACVEHGSKYGIEWAGDLDGDGEPDFIFDWSLTETFGLTLGLSRDPPPQAKLRFAAALYDGCS